MRYASGSHVMSQDPASAAIDVREKLKAAISSLEDIIPAPVQQGPVEPVTEETIRAVLKSRRNRERHFPADLFADPAWDMLLELYAAALGQRRMSVSSLCSGGAVPPTTALRWIGALEKHGLLRRSKDPFDGRRVFVALSEDALRAMRSYFGANPAAVGC